MYVPVPNITHGRIVSNTKTTINPNKNKIEDIVSELLRDDETVWIGPRGNLSLSTLLGSSSAVLMFVLLGVCSLWFNPLNHCDNFIIKRKNKCPKRNKITVKSKKKPKTMGGRIRDTVACSTFLIASDSSIDVFFTTLLFFSCVQLWWECL